MFHPEFLTGLISSASDTERLSDYPRTGDPLSLAITLSTRFLLAAFSMSSSREVSVLTKAALFYSVTIGTRFSEYIGSWLVGERFNCSMSSGVTVSLY